MNHTQTTPPTVEPVTVAEMRAHLGIGQTDDTQRDNIIAGRITTARMMAESYARIAIMPQTWTARGSAFFDTVIPLRGPLRSVESVLYIDTAGDEQTMEPLLYDVDVYDNCLIPAYGSYWPTARGNANSVRVDYVCGFSDADAVPPPIKDAIMFIVGWLESYQNSIEGNGPLMGMPRAAQQLLEPYKDWRELV